MDVEEAGVPLAIVTVISFSENARSTTAENVLTDMRWWPGAHKTALAKRIAILHVYFLLLKQNFQRVCTSSRGRNYWHGNWKEGLQPERVEQHCSVLH